MTTTTLFARSIPRRRFSACALAAVLIIFGTGVAASASDEAPALDLDTKPRLDRRAQGLAYFDLPMQMRARFDATYMKDRYASEVLARPYIGTTGPSIQGSGSLASQFALTRSLSDTVEIGVVWGARSRIGRINLFDFERQTIGAMIRFVP